MAEFSLEKTININGKTLEVTSKTPVSTAGKVLIGVTGTPDNVSINLSPIFIKELRKTNRKYLSEGGVALGLSLVCASFVSPAFRRFCLPYIPATEQQVLNVFHALKTKNRTGLLVDLGSGDGRIVFEAARRDFRAHGVELNTWLVAYSKLSAFWKRSSTRATFSQQDLWKFSLEKYDNIVIFGVEQMMEELERKFVRECKPGCAIVACRFPLPGTRPEIVVGSGVDTVWLYRIGTSRREL